MADLVGKLVADFAPFYEACQKAEVSLKSFETEAVNVEKSLNRMTDQFSGRKVIQDATLMAEAIERIGGTTKLTEAELERVSRTAGQAVEKMKALGIEVPASIQSLATATKSTGAAAEDTSKSLGTMAAKAVTVGQTTKEAGTLARGASAFFGDLGSQLAGMLTAGALVGFGKQVLDTADNIGKMAKQTSTTTDEIQRLMYISETSGSSMGSLINAMQTLQKGIGTENTGTVAAIKQLGLNFNDLKTQSPYSQLTTTAEAIRNIKDPTDQAALAAKLYGGAWKEALPAIKDGMAETGANATIMGEKAVKAAADTKQALNDAKSVGTVALAAVIEKIQDTAFWWQRLSDMMLDKSKRPESFAELLGLGTDTADLLQSIANPLATVSAGVADLTQNESDLKLVMLDLNAQYEQSLAENKKREEATQRMAKADAEARKELERLADVYYSANERLRPYEERIADLDATMVASIATYLRAGVSIQDIADITGVHATKIEAVNKALDAEDAALDRAAASADLLRGAQAELLDLQARHTGGLDAEIAVINRWADDYVQALKDAGTWTKELGAVIDQLRTEKIAGLSLDWGALNKASRTSLEDTARVAENTYTYALEHSYNYTSQQVEQFRITAEAARAAANNWGLAFDEAGAAGVEAARQVALSWSEAMDLVRQGQGVMSGQIGAGGPGTMTNYGPWGSAEHTAAIAKAYAQGRYFGPVKTRTGGRESYDVDWSALGIPDAMWGGTPTVNNTFHVNGTGQDVARVVLDEITRSMKTSRKWPAV